LLPNSAFSYFDPVMLQQLLLRHMLMGKSPTSAALFLFETNQAGEPPIILKRRNNVQGTTTTNKDTTTGQSAALFQPLQLFRLPSVGYFVLNIYCNYLMFPFDVRIACDLRVQGILSLT